MKRAATRSFRWLVVDLNEAAADLQADHACAGDDFVPNDGCSEHSLEEPDRGARIRSEDMGVVEADSHSVQWKDYDAERSQPPARAARRPMEHRTSRASAWAAGLGIAFLFLVLHVAFLVNEPRILFSVAIHGVQPI
jgi:hypothetical protein